MRVLVIGGTGSFSARLVEKAVQRGHEVMVYTRGQRPVPGGPTVQPFQAERSALRSHAAALAAFAPEVVVDSICFDPERAQDLIATFPSLRRLVLISSVDVYGEDVGSVPVTEERRPEPVTPYARAKLACEAVVLGGFGPRATVFRPSHILGRTFLTTSLWGRTPYLVDRLRKGKLIAAIDGGRNLMTPVHAADVAEWVLRSFDNPAADGQVFNAVGGETVTQKQYYECIAAALGVGLSLAAVPSQVFRRHFDAPSQFNWHRPYSCAKAIATLGYRPQATLRVMLEETVAYMLENGLVRDCAEQPFDDALVALLARHEAELGALLVSRSA